MKELIERYQYFFFDLWGVIYDGKGIYKNVNNILQYIKKKKKKIIIVSNSSKSKPQTLEFLKIKGLNINLINDIFTSGDFTKFEFFNSKKKFFPIDGRTKKNLQFLKRLKLNTAKNFEDTDLAIAITVNKHLDPKKIMNNLKICKKKKLKLICVNPDFKVINSYYGMGYFYNKYLNLGGRGEYYGKPNPKFYKFIFSKLKINTKKKILFIGDTIYNDIVGANYFGIDSLLIKKSKLYKYKMKDFKLLSYKKKNIFKPKFILNELKF